MQFKSKLVSATSGILFLSLSALSFNQYLNVKTSIDNLVENSVNEISDSVATNVAAIIDGKKTLARYIVSLVENKVNHDDILAVINNPVVKREFIMAGAGFAHDGSQMDNDPSWVPPEGFDTRTRPWFIEAKKQMQLIVSSPYSDGFTKEIMVSFGVPMMQYNQLAAVAFFDVSLKGLGDIVNQLNMLDAGYAFLVSGKGNFIAHPDIDRHGKPMTDLYGHELEPSDELQVVMLDGQEKLIKFTQVDGVDWSVGVVLDADKINETVVSLRNQAIIYSALALILGFFAIYILIGRLMRPLTQITRAMQDIANGEGDLTKRIEPMEDIEFNQLASAFNAFTDKLQILIKDSKLLSEQITYSTEKTASESELSVEAISQQLHELEQLAAAMNQMSSTSLEVAGYAKQAAQSAETADAEVATGTNIVNVTSDSILQLSSHIEDAVAEVKQLEGSIVNIETILSVINGIAEQTNLLALNAAIEAARAGEQGRGFAVVADEVRSLAQRTQESTSEIKLMIESLQQSSVSVATVMAKSRQEASESVEKAQQANDALSSISEAIKEISNMNLHIATAAQEQSSVSSEVNRNTCNIKEISQQLADNATSTCDVMLEQKETTQKQHEALGRFIV